MKEQRITRPARIDDLVPFCGDGHYHSCLDYRKSGREAEPRITYIDVESFNVDEVVTHGEPAAVAAAVSGATGVAFEDQGDQDHGYRVFCACLAGIAPSWAWLSANRVRRGFVRTTDNEYAKLAKLLPEIVDRHSERADCGSS